MKKLTLILIILLLLVLIKNLAFSIYKKLTTESVTGQLTSQLREQQKRKIFLEEQLKYTQTNEFIENEARRKLGLVKAGEHIVFASQPTTTSLVIKQDMRPNWKKWWDLFF